MRGATCSSVLGVFRRKRRAVILGGLVYAGLRPQSGILAKGKTLLDPDLRIPVPEIAGAVSGDTPTCANDDGSRGEMIGLSWPTLKVVFFQFRSRVAVRMRSRLLHGD